MTTLIQAAEQALEALQIWQDSLTDPSAIPGWRFSVVGEKAIANLRAALAEDAMQRLTDVNKEMDCYGDGNVYRGQRSSDSKEQTITFSKVETVEPVAWLIESYNIYTKRTLQRLVFDKPENMHGVKITAYYSATPKLKQLTDEDIAELCTRYGVGYPPVVSPYTRRLIEAVEQKLMEKNKS